MIYLPENKDMERDVKMRKVVLYIAMSLDGYICDEEGQVDWLSGHGDDDSEGSYENFIQNVDTVIMGRTTYEQVTSVLSPDVWSYDGLKAYVVTHRLESMRLLTGNEDICAVNENPCELVRRLRDGDGKGIWICGGAAIIHPLICENLIDEYVVSVIPTLLGGGVRLFDRGFHEMKLRLKKTEVYDGIAELIYERR